MSTLLDRATEIARAAHTGQRDKGGAPYIGHPMAVAEKVQGEKEKILALLHDVVEDSGITLEDIRSAGFGEEVVEALDCITKRKGEPYDGYLARVAGNRLARVVKLADLSHNMDTSRLSTITEKDLKRMKKYEDAVSFLSGGL